MPSNARSNATSSPSHARRPFAGDDEGGDRHAHDGDHDVNAAGSEYNSSAPSTVLHGETTPLLSKHSSTPPPNMSIATYLSQPVSKRHADLILLFSYIITGLLDSSSVLIWGSFVSMQTGNTVYLGSGLVSIGLPTNSDRWLRALISIASFLAGSFVFSRFHRALSASRRGVLVVATAVQMGLIAAAAVMVTVGPEANSRISANTLSTSIDVWIAVPIVLVAFQSAGQAVVSRVVGFNALTGVVLTSIYLDLAADPKLFAGPRANAERNRRVAAPILLLIGALIGGVWANSSVGMMGALWTAVGLKAAVMMAWMFWAAEKETGAEDAV